MKADVQDLGRAIAQFRERSGRLPRSLGELVRAGILATIPLDPDGNAYVYDPSSAAVSSAVSRVLGS